jgi:hypothetical protein
MRFVRLFLLVAVTVMIGSCTQEQQNVISRSIQNWTGTNGVLDIYSGGKLVMRLIEIDKISTAQSTSGENIARPYRFGYGVIDANYNYQKDRGEKKTYFEISDFSTEYVFYENPS